MFFVVYDGNKRLKVCSPIRPFIHMFTANLPATIAVEEKQVVKYSTLLV